MMLKKCNACGKELPLTMFYTKEGSKDGLTKQCKTCRGLYNIVRYRAKHPNVKFIRTKKKVTTYPEGFSYK